MAHLGPNDYRDLHTPARQQTEGVLNQMSELGERAQTDTGQGSDQRGQGRTRPSRWRAGLSICRRRAVEDRTPAAAPGTPANSSVSIA